MMHITHNLTLKTNKKRNSKITVGNTNIIRITLSSKVTALKI
jgi:hypothetical protein